MPICHSCQQPFADFKALALHIASSKKGHRKGKMWAAKYLSNQRALDMKTTMQNRNHTPLTQQEKDNKANAHRELSGKVVNTDTICPHCKRQGISQLPIEYAHSSEAWRAGKCLVKLCISCGGEGQ